MSEPKWTKAPWSHMPYRGYCHFIQSDGDKLAPRIATITYSDGVHSRHEADARLIAAAPELYEALVGAMHALRSYQFGNAATDDLAKELADRADAVLAKARGEQESQLQTTSPGLQNRGKGC